MFCSKCGNELKNNEMFCPKCGTKVELETEEVKDEKTNNEAPTVSKKKFLIAIIIIVILIGFIIALFINMRIFREKIKNRGHFEKIDGVDTYLENGKLVTNSLVMVRGKKIYYVDEKGHKKKNTWEVIDNEGTYGYFGSLGELVKNKIREIDGKKYYFDENGKLIVDTEIEINGIGYKANDDGELTALTDDTNVEMTIEETEIAKTIPTQANETQIVNTQEQTKVAQTTITQTTVPRTALAPVQTAVQTQAVQADFSNNGNVVVGAAPVSNEIAKEEVQIQQTQQQVQQTQPKSQVIQNTATIKNDNASETEKKKLAVDGGPVTEETVNIGPGAGISGGFAVKGEAIGSKNLSKEDSYEGYYDEEDEEEEYEIKILSTAKETDSVEDDDGNECVITLVIPEMQGKNDYETEALNGNIEELMGELYDEVESIVNDYDKLPKSVIFTTPTLGSTSKSKILINFTGTITLRTGSTKSIKYRITYNREEEDATLTKVS